MDNSESSFPNRIRFLRKQMGVTQEVLASAINKTPAHVGKLETGGRELTKPVIDLLAKALGVLPADLLKESDGGLTEEERRMISVFRAAPPSIKKVLGAAFEASRLASED